MIVKNFNRRSSYDHHGSKRRELAQHAHSHGLHAFTHTLVSTQLQPLFTKRQLNYYRIWNRIFILRYLRDISGVNRFKSKYCIHNSAPKPTSVQLNHAQTQHCIHNSATQSSFVQLNHTETQHCIHNSVFKAQLCSAKSHTNLCTSS